MPGRRVFVVGVGMTKFEKPMSKKWDYPDMASLAVNRALTDACLEYTDVEQAAVGYTDTVGTGGGQRALYPLGMTGIPVYNVNNACATGSSALFMAKQFIEGGLCECALALGFEKMKPGPLGGGAGMPKGATPLDYHLESMTSKYDFAAKPLTPQMFGNAAREHMAKYGSTPEHLYKIAEKNHRHSQHNPYSQFRDVHSLDQVAGSKMVYEPLTKLACCPTSDGAAAVLVASEDFVRARGLEGQAVEILSMTMATDVGFSKGEFDSCIKMVGKDMAIKAANEVYSQSGLQPKDVQVIELHDCFASNELLTYEAIGLCGEGEGGKLIDSGDVTYGGKWVVNPSGGLISKGHPLGATGLAQCSEICWQLRGECGPRQVPSAKVGMQHNLGLGGACVMAMYKRPEEWHGVSPKRAVSGAMGFPEDIPAKL